MCANSDAKNVTAIVIRACRLERNECRNNGLIDGSEDAKSTGGKPSEGQDGDGHHAKQEFPSLLLGQTHGTTIAGRADII
jgi:hypothetical protein